MKTKVQKWGNSYAVRLPIEIIKKQCLEQGALLSVEEKNGKIVLNVVSPQEEENLQNLVDKITPENLHPEEKWGEVHGSEAW